MWESAVDGQRLTFHLAGINNQNFIMRDDETGSWWQQVSGQAIQGPHKNRLLTNVLTDEVTFAVWKREHPKGRVLRPDERVRQKYEGVNWEAEYEKFPVVVPVPKQDRLKPRDLVVGIGLHSTPIAYAMDALKKERLILHQIESTRFFVVLGDDQKSVRAFDRTVDGRVLEFFLKADTTPLQFVDAETGSTWDFSGKALTGALAGKQLKQIPVLKDYWFDWKLYHPETSVYAAQ